ncbi:MAG: AI-2E family transporter [Fimbriimonadaceae bacterium]|nr:AI-2E family transporter [Fimbriimonadaceae bacterium]
MGPRERQSGQRFLFWGFVVAVIVLGALIVAPFVPALTLATVLAVLLAPWRDRLLARGKSVTASSLVPVLLATALVFTPLVTAVGVAGAQAFGYVQSLSDDPAESETTPVLDRIAADMDHTLAPVFKQVGASNFSVQAWLAENRPQLIQTVRGPVVDGLGRFLNGILQVVVAVMTAFFGLRDGKNLVGPVCECVPLPPEQTREILNRTAQTIRSVFVGVVAVAFVQGALAGVAYLVAGVHGWLLWTLATCFFAMVPLLGPPIVYVPVAAFLAVQGRVGPAVGVLAWGFLVVSNIDNFLRPLIVGAQTKLHPMAIFFALVGGVLFMGPSGLMAGPVVLTLLIGLSEIVREVKSNQTQPVDSPA